MKLKWDIYRYEVMESIEYFDRYFHLANAQIEEAHHLSLSEINSAPDSDYDDDSYTRETAAEWCNKEYESEYTPRTRNSLVVFLFTILETRLQALCSEIQKRRNYELGWKDISGTSIERLAKYLHHVAHVTDKTETAWLQLGELVSIRNCIVHANGLIADANDRTRTHIRHIITTRNDISLTDNGMLLISTEYIQKTTDLIRSLFSSIFDNAGFGPEKPIFG